MPCRGNLGERGPAHCGVCGVQVTVENGDLVADAALMFVGEWTTVGQAEADEAEILEEPIPTDKDTEIPACHDVIVTCASCRKTWLTIGHIICAHFDEVSDQLLALIRPAGPDAQKPH